MKLFAQLSRQALILSYRCLQIEGVRYALTLFLVLAVALVCAKLFGVKDPMWLLISCVISIDVECEQLKKIIVNRILATLIGVIVGTGSLLIFGPGYLSIMVGVMFLMILCHAFTLLWVGWRVTVITAIIVLVSGLQEASVLFAEQMAIKRAAEVISGCFIAGVISLLMGVVWKNIDAHA